MRITRANHIIQTILAWSYCHDYEDNDYPDLETFSLDEIITANKLLIKTNEKAVSKGKTKKYIPISEKLICAFYTVSNYDHQEKSIIQYHDKFLFIIKQH